MEFLKKTHQNNLSYTATKSRIQRARKQLKKKFLNCCLAQADKYGNPSLTDNKDVDC